jgi:hypothetical protein
MELMTIKQYAQSQHISYEAIRKQVVAYKHDLQDHIIRKGRTQYLDEYAIEFLTKRRRESPVIVLEQSKDETIADLKDQIDALRVQLMAAQNELLREKDHIIELQEESRKSLEAQARYTALLEENESKDEQIKELTEQRDAAVKEAQSYQPSLFGFYRKV